MAARSAPAERASEFQIPRNDSQIWRNNFKAPRDKNQIRSNEIKIPVPPED
jgi:hypothetical protein